MSIGSIIALGLLFLAVDFVVVGSILYICSQGVRTLCGKFPPMARNADSVTRRFQSFKVRSISLGFSVHVAADERALHLSPARAARWLGMSPMSIPWDAMTDAKAVLGGVRVKVGDTEITGPAWCMGLAVPTHTQD